MPEATQYIFEQANKKAYKEIEEAYAKEHNSRSEAIKRRWRYFDGDHDLPLKVQSDGYNDNVIVNHVEALTERITAFLVGEGITFDASGDDQTTPDDDNIKAIWQANRGELLIENIVLSGAIEGHNTVRVQPQEGDLPKLIRIKQANFAAFWDPFDMSRVLWYRLQHTAGATMGKRIDYIKGAVDPEGGEVDHAAEGWTEAVFRMTRQNTWELERLEPWPFDWPPLVDWQNLPNANGYYGKDDVKGAIRLNDALNFILSNTQRIVKHWGDPKTIGIGFTPPDVVKTEVGGLFTVNKPRSEVDVFNLEMQSDGALIQWLTSIIQSGLWESGGMVDPSNVKDLVGQLTNFGLRVLFVNALQRTNKKRLLYQEAFEAIGKHALDLAGLNVPDTIATVWPDVLPEDQATVDMLMRELEGGIISKETYRKLRGYDNEEEENRLAGERTTGDVGANILGLIASNRPFNNGGL